MKRKSLLFFLLAALFVPLAMNGQQTAVLNDGTSTMYYVPFYGLYADYGAKGQFIIPATDLANKGITSGSQISKLKFFSNSTGTGTYFGTSVIVEVGEVSNTTFNSSAFVTSGLTTVLSGTSLSRSSDGTLVIQFTTNYTYTGGNLLISIGGYGSNCPSTSWYGVSSTNAGVYGYNSSSNAGSIPSSANGTTSYAPKTEITYLPGNNNPYISLAPAAATLLTGSTETLTATYGNVSGTPTITYTSSNTSVATVSGNGTTATVTAVAPGTATITATMNGSYTATCAITVEDPSYCTPNPSSVDGKGITAVTFGTDDVVNNSNSNGLPASSPYYGDYTSMVGSSEAGETVTVAITYSTGSSTVYSYGTLIWVDWNKNYTFEDSEIVYTGTSAQGSNGTPQVLTATFTVPATQAADDYRMRIAGADSYFDSYIGGSTSANHSPCFSSTYAVCHDYTLRVTPASNCKKPTDLAATNVTKNSATLSWIENGEATAWNISVNGTVTPNVTNPYNLTGLTPETSYTVKVSPVCEDERWSDEITFTTLVACPAPTNVSASNVTNSSAVINWEGNADSYNVRYRVAFFEGFENGIPATWTTIDADNDGNNWFALSEMGTLYPAYANSYLTNWRHSGSNSAVSASAYNNTDGETYTALNSNQWLISPQIDLGGFLKFYAKSADEDFLDSYEVLLSTNGTAIADFDITLQAMGTASADWDEVVIDLSNYSGQGYIAIHHVTEDAYFLLIDDFSISGNPWLTPSNSPVAANTITLTGLDAETDYEVQVQADCGSEDGASAWVSTTFTTLDDCALPYELNVTNLTAASATLNWTGAQEAYNVQYREVITEPVNLTYDFEDGTLQGWTAIDNDGDGNAWMVGSTPHTGSYCARSYYTPSGSSYNANNWLVSPQITLGGELSFYARQYNNNGDERFQVFVSTSGTNISDFTAISEVINPSSTYQQYTYSLSGYSGQGYIAIVHTSTTSYAWYIYVDDITIVRQGEYGPWVTKTNVTSQLNIDDFTPTIENGNHYLPTNYEWQVQGVDCDGNGTATDWSAPATFTTPEGYVKEITGYGTGTGNWYLIASPIGNVDPANVTNMLSNSYDLFYFDQAKENEWVNYKPGQGSSASGFGIEKGKGYLYANSNDVDLVFTGSAYTTTNGKETVQLAYTNTADGYVVDLPGWNLVGNPFAEKAYLEGNRGFYTMDGDGNFTPVTNASIESMEGIFVVANPKVEEDAVTFTTTEPAPSGKLSLNLSNGRKAVDRAIVRFDGGNQLPKLQLFGERTKLYIPVEGQDYAIVNAEEMGEMPVSFKAENNGSYTLSVNAEEVSFAYLHLIDNMTGADVDLLETPSYSFEAKTTDYASRFKLVFATGNASDDTFAFFSNGSFVINNEGNAELQVIDIMGRIVKSESINGCANVSVNSAAGVYMLRLVNGDNVKVQKVVVR